VTQVHSKIMRDLDNNGTSAITIKYVAGDVEPIKRRTYEALRTWPTDSSRLYTLNGRDVAKITWVYGHPVIDLVEKPDDLPKILASRMKFCRLVTDQKRTYTVP